MTIRKRLSLWYSGLIIIIIVILSLAVIAISRVSILNTIDQFLLRTGEDIARAVTIVPVGEFGSPDAQIMVGGSDIIGSQGLSIQIWQTVSAEGEANAELLYASLDSRMITAGLDPSAMDVTAPQFETLTVNRTMARVASLPLNDPISGDQIGVIQLATSIQFAEQANHSLLIVISIAAAVSIIVSMLLSMWLSGRVLKPVDRITQAAASIARAEDLSTRLTWEGPVDELGQLADVFNHMMERLEHLFSVQQRFVGDVSHELRTPLTSILGNLELIERYGYDAESLDAVQREAARMSRMVNDLLLLARADNGELQVELYPMELDPTVLEVYEEAHILAKKRDLKIELGKLDALKIQGNKDRMKQLLLNLVGNAIKFTPDGGKIIISAYRQNNEAVIEVQDTGIGISPADKKRIFDRFFQADNSRAHRDESDGAGLGLSIAYWIVTAHHGRIDVDSQVGQGTTFRVFIPLSA